MVELQCLIGMQCDDFVMITADQTHTPHTIIVMKNDEKKLYEVADGLLMGIIGESGEAVQFEQFVSKNIMLYKMRNNYNLDTAAAVHFTRKNMADRMRTPAGPAQLNLLIAGYDAAGGSQLYTINWLSDCMKVPYAVHGFGGMLSWGILDQHYKNSLKVEEAYKVLKLCVREIHQRLFFNLPNFQVKFVCKSGVHELPPITPASFDADGQH